MTTEFRKWLAVGTGVGIEIAGDELQVTIARVRPSGVAVLGSAVVTDYRNRPATEWGTELAAFLKQLGCAHIAATVLLPRRDVVVRQIQLPGVSNKDLESAVSLQIDSLHPFAEEDALYAFARIGKTPSILVGITRREIVDSYSNLFAEAGVKVASFTFSAAAIYSAIRLYADPPADGFVAVHPGLLNSDVEVYGESVTHPIFSANFDRFPERALAHAVAELRLPPTTEALPVQDLLPKPAVFPPNHDPEGAGFGRHALPYATALAGACPWLGIPGNLLPPERRRTSSRIRLIPTIILTVILGLLGTALALYSSYENKRYLNLLQTEIRRVEPRARMVESLDKKISLTRARTQLLDEFRRHSKADMDALNELTHLLAPPTYLIGMELKRDSVIVNGETEQAAALIKIIDGSPLFENSEFTTSYTRAGAAEIFGIRATRSVIPAIPAAHPAAAVTTPPPATPPAPTAQPAPTTAQPAPGVTPK
jgi:Tfp pilus assembly protein PilN